MDKQTDDMQAYDTPTDEKQKKFSQMSIIVRANLDKFETEDKDMCEALMELMADKIFEKEQIAEQRGRTEGQLMEREHNIKIFILDYLSENFSKEKILHKIQANFQLKEDQAEEYFAKYAHKAN